MKKKERKRLSTKQLFIFQHFRCVKKWKNLALRPLIMKISAEALAARYLWPKWKTDNCSAMAKYLMKCLCNITLTMKLTNSSTNSRQHS